MVTLQSSQVAVTLRVLGVPKDTPAGAVLHVAGDFNDWDASDSHTRLRPGPNGTFISTFTVPLGSTVQYKYTRGTWATAEGSPDQTETPNRSIRVLAEGQEFDDVIEAWHDQAETITRPMLGSVDIIRGFAMPQLKSSRRIWVYLPPDYKTSHRRYPVLYMHDGQNLFDEKSSFSGEWYVDRTIEELFTAGKTRGAIVVAPDNGGAARLAEYSPWEDTRHRAGGKGAAYMDFLVHTLKPFIDASFRTLPGREHTGLVGSSMGGLISMYAALQYSEVFSRVGAFSPAFWFAERQILELARAMKTSGRPPDPMRIYLDVGGREGHDPKSEKEEVDDVINMFYLLKEAGFNSNELKLVFDDQAGHTESAWAERFAAAYLWLLDGHS